MKTGFGIMNLESESESRKNFKIPHPWFPYLDDTTVAGNTLEELEENSGQFDRVFQVSGITLNESKTVRKVQDLKVLGYHIKDHIIGPDRTRMQPLMEMPDQLTLENLKRTRGLFAFYAKWINYFSTKIKPLSAATSFLLSKEAV